ncbi:MAG: HAMP domain-containing sensor histidine kinase [Nitrolancea sp.]
MSGALASALGYAPSDFRADRLLLHRLTIDADRKRIARFLSNSTAPRPSIVVTWRSRSRRVLHMELSARAIQTEDGQVVALIVTARPRATSEEIRREGHEVVRRLGDVVDESEMDLNQCTRRLVEMLLDLGSDFALVLCDRGRAHPPLSKRRSRAEHPDIVSALDTITNEWQSQTTNVTIRHPTIQVTTKSGNREFSIDLNDLGLRIPHSSIVSVPIRNSIGQVGAIVFGSAPNMPPMTPQIKQQSLVVARSAANRIELHLLRQEVAELARSRDRFLSTMAHELKTPLTSIRGYAQLLGRFLDRESPDLNRSRRAVDGLGTQVDRFIMLTEDLLDAARINQNKVNLRLEEANLCAIARDVSDRMSAFESRQFPRVIVDASEDLAGTWDVARIDQLIEILLSNALRYSSDREVHVAVQTEGDEAVLSVSDVGIGIDEQDLERIFEPFERGRVAAGLTTGSGLGLYRAREIVRHHGGSMEIDSRLNDGTTVTVRLPINAPSPEY